MGDRDYFAEMDRDLDRYGYYIIYGKHYKVHVTKYSSHYSITLVKKKGITRLEYVFIDKNASPIALRCAVIDFVRTHLGKDIA